MSKKDKSLKAIPCEELNEKQIELLYKFLQDKDTIYNKDRSLSSSILWDVIYLRKIFSKSVYSRKSGKYRAKYNYVILEDDKIITFFTLHHISKKIDLNILELYFILNESILENSNFFNETKNLIIKEYENILNLIGYNTIMTLYIPSNNIKINELLFSDFELAYVDKETFRDSYQIYYKVMLNSFFEDTKGITKSNIITKILEHYGLNIIFNPRVESRLKLTRKSLHLDDIKIITKDIMEVKELQNLPEYDYDLNKMMFLIKLLMDYVNYNYKYLDNNLNNFAMKLYFPSNIIIFNNKLFDIFTGILKNTISLSLQCISKQNILFYNIKKYSYELC